MSLGAPNPAPSSARSCTWYSFTGLSPSIVYPRIGMSTRAVRLCIPTASPKIEAASSVVWISSVSSASRVSMPKMPVTVDAAASQTVSAADAVAPQAGATTGLAASQTGATASVTVYTGLKKATIQRAMAGRTRSARRRLPPDIFVGKMEGIKTMGALTATPSKTERVPLRNMTVTMVINAMNTTAL